MSRLMISERSSRSLTSRSNRATSLLGAAWPVIVAGASTLPLVWILASGRTLVWGDTAVLFGPIRPLVVEAIRELRIPLWNPYSAMGIPLHAQMIHAALHPVSVLAAWIAPGAGMDLFIVLNVVIAALGAASLSRTFDVSPGAACAAGFAYGLSGYLLGMASVLQYQTAAATAPWAIAGLRRAARGTRGSIALGALGFGVLHLAGDPQWTIVATVLGVGFAAEAGGVRGSLTALVAVALGALVGAVQWVPAVAFIAHTERGAAGITPADQAQWALSPWRIVEFAAPGFFAGNASENLRAPVYLWFEPETQSRLLRPFVPSIFVGVVTLSLAVLAGLRRRPERWLSAATLVLMWIALGHHLGAQQVLGGVPVWGSFRYSEKLVGPMTLCLALLAARGADQLSSFSDHAARRAMYVTGALAAGALALAVLLLLPIGSWLDAADGLVRRSLGEGLLHAAAGLFALTVVALARRTIASRRHVAWLSALVVFASACGGAPYALHAGARNVRDDAPLATIRTDGPVTRIATPLVDPPFANPLGLGGTDLDVAAKSRMGVEPFNVLSRIDQVDVYTGLTPGRVIHFVERFGPDVWTTLRRFSLTHVVAQAPRDQSMAQLLAAATHGGSLVSDSPAWGFSVWAVPHQSWARFAPRVHAARSDDAALEAMAAYDLAGIDAAVVQGPPPNGTSAGRIIASERHRESIRVDAEADGPAFLLVEDSYWPGWVATIDGKPAPIFQADYLVRGVEFPPGRHVLEMRYEPREARLGGALTCVGLALAAALGSSAAWRRRRDRQEKR